VSERGSAMLLAIIVLALLTSMGIALLFLGQSELRMSAADVRSKQAFFLAEAAVESGRQALFNTNGDGPFDDDLVASAGGDGAIDFDPATVIPVYDGQGQITGFAGFDDDIALVGTTQLGAGWHAAFLTNDPGETGGIGDTNDTNDRVMITGVAGTFGGSFEIVQVVIEPAELFPADVPGTITMFGPNPSFSDVDDAAKVFRGDDCSGAGIPGFSVPVVGLIGTPNEVDVEGTLGVNTIYTSAGNSGHWTVVDLTDPTDPGVVASAIGTIDPAWTDCEALRQMTEETRSVADVVCTEGVSCTLPASASDRIVFSDGDFTLDSSMSGSGMIWVTGTLTMDGATDWNGLVVVVGEGVFARTGAGTGRVSGASIVADIAGPDNTYGTSDDCTGGTEGFDQAVYDESLGGTGETVYCNADVLAATPLTKYAVKGFRQR
jgi:hypothetical protein